MSFWQSSTVNITIILAVVIVAGCRTRGEYYRLADTDAYCLLNEKSAGTPWALPFNFAVESPIDSRHYNPDCLGCPTLPAPVTPLYSYDLSALGYNQLIRNNSQSSAQSEDDTLRASPIPLEAWNAIPNSCLQRMLDFQSIRDEAEFTSREFGNAISVQQEVDIPRLKLEDVVELALKNSRDYQAQKESLYLVALQLSQERFRYQFQFAPNGVGTAANYTHNRAGGTTVNNLSLPTNVQGQKMLVTGGDLLASFANNVLLTFNGPSGFATDVSSDVLLQISQPLIQTDVRFESLTQAERNVVYAARDFARFRKQFFVDFASRYYSLIRSFRQIEINSQNYFSLVRTFNQAQAEYRAGIVPRVQVDQVEQSLLSGRGQLIGTCVGVEQSLDQLKLALGIPTETPINIDLEELNQLTQLDQRSVSADSTNRVLFRLNALLNNPNRIELTSTGAVLLDRVIESAMIDPQYETSQRVVDYKIMRLGFLIDYARLTSQQILADLMDEVNSDSPSVPVIFQRSQAHSKALLNLVDRQLQLSRLKQDSQQDSRIVAFEQRQAELRSEIDQLQAQLQTIIQEQSIEELPKLVEASNELRASIELLVKELDTFNESEVENDSEKDLQRIVSAVRQLLVELSPELAAAQEGLAPVEIDMDDAMITALVMRFDLMNQRGSLADDWRQIKLAADELKSVINLNASQRISTDPTTNQPFNFSFDDSQTAIRLSVDAPFNRFAQRNTFRSTLIGYQRALRNLTLLEDNIKFSVRNDLRNLSLDREQYLIAVASAALAYERVVSTSIEFRLGTGSVSARDFLEAQTAYTNALSDVASRHIDYILDRTQLFLDLELLTVNEDGVWDDIRNENIQPQPYFSIQPWGQPVYGELPCVYYSNEIRQMLCVPGDAILGQNLPETDAGESTNIPIIPDPAGDSIKE